MIRRGLHHVAGRGAAVMRDMTGAIARRYKECKRTPGVSTTDLVSRMISREKVEEGEAEPEVVSPYQRGSDDFLLSSRQIAHFASGNIQPGPDTKVVYMPGMFDMFHNGACTTSVPRQLITLHNLRPGAPVSRYYVTLSSGCWSTCLVVLPVPTDSRCRATWNLASHSI
jgi:hypothetical protein